MILFYFLWEVYAQNESKIYTERDLQVKIAQQVEKEINRLKNLELSGFIAELMKKEKDLEKREKELKEQFVQLEISKQKFEKQIQTHLNNQNELLGCMEQINEDKEKRITRMVEIISSMKPDKAAQVLSIQDAELTIKILGLLDAKLVSKMFNLMDKEISARLQKQFMTMKR